jgi:hypothetical protein
MKRIGLILIVICCLISCDSNSAEAKIMDILDNDNIEGYSEQEIVILSEVHEYLLRHFLITYDDFRNAYKEYSYVTKNIDNTNASGFILNTSGPEDLILSDLIGLNTKEMYSKIFDIRNSLGYPEIPIESEGLLGLEYSISDVYEGYDPGESFVYFRIEQYEQNSRHSSVYRYHFKTVDGMKKVFLKKALDGASCSENEDLNEYLEDREVYYHRKTGQSYEEILVEYPIVFDINKLAKKYFDSDNNYSEMITKTSEKNIEKPIYKTDGILDVVKGENIGDYKQYDIVLLYEIKKFLYNNSQITYDEFRNVYNDFFYVGPNIDDEYTFHVQNDNFIGLSIEESRDYIIKNVPKHIVDGIDDTIAINGDSKYLMYISDIIPGYDDDESIVYVRKELKSSDSNMDQYWLYKYTFKEVNGQHKIFTHKTSRMFFDGLNAVKLSKEDLLSEMKRFEEIYSYEGEVEFPYVFDLRDFCEENLY